MAYGVIYKITNKFNGMPYIGQTTRPIEERFREHARRDTFLGRTIKKYGKENFLIEIIEECETLEKLNECEKFWIAYFNCISPNGYNLTEGGEGSIYTDEHRKNLSRAMSGEKNPHYGKHHTSEAKEQIAASRRGKKLPAETCAKMSISKKGSKHHQYGKPLTKEWKEKLSASQPRKRAVVCVELQKVYPSLTRAARCYKTTATNILFACKNPHRTTRGFHWRFLADVDDIANIEIPPAPPRKTTRCQPVICIELNTSYDSIKMAAEYHKIKAQNISFACRNTHRTAGGYHWKYIQKPQA